MDIIFEKVNWFDYTGADKSDNNEGKIFGIVCYDENDNFIEAWWYRSRLWRWLAYYLRTNVDTE